jgi:hypothetical protein
MHACSRVSSVSDPPIKTMRRKKSIKKNEKEEIIDPVAYLKNIV